MLQRLPTPLRQVSDRLLGNPLFRRVLRNTGYLFSASSVSAALSMLQSILAARLLGVEGFGLLGTITVFASVLNRLTSFRMGDLVVSYVGEFIGQERTDQAAAAFKAASLTEVGSSILAYTLLILMAPWGARVFADDPTLTGLFLLYGLIVLANLMSESAAGLLQIYDRYRMLALFTVGQSALTLLLIAGAFATGGGLLSIVSAYLVGKVVWAISVSIASLWVAGQEWGRGWWRTPLGLLEGRWRGMARFAISTNLTGSLTLVTRDSEVLWLGAFSSPLQVGYYKVTLAILNFLFIPIQPLINATYREVAREVGRKAWDNVRYLLRSGSLLAAGFSLPAAVVLVVLGPWIVGLWGSEFLPTAYTALLILLVGVTVINIFYWNRNVLLPLGLPDVPTRVYLVAALLKILGIFLFVPRYGAHGMAFLLSAFFLGTALALVWRTRRELRRSEALPVVSGG